MRSNTSQIRFLAITLAVVAALTAMSPVLAAAQTQYGGYIMFGAVAVVSQTTPLYQNSGFSITLESAKANAQAIVINWTGDSVKVYLPESKRAGWLSRSSLRLTNERFNLAVVCSQTITIRQSASVSSQQLTTASNGQALDVQDAQDEWFYVRYVNPSTKREYFGYVRSDFVAYQPDWLVAHALLDVYAMPKSGSNRIAQIAKGTSLMILGEMDGYLCVNLRNAAGFVRTRDARLD
ncbi:MAG: SH3 domain-containing protein [Oscillospiraceae bacterium]|nr:SH3 domain-containing protein [Oscillospiraceae bacterium]